MADAISGVGGSALGGLAGSVQNTVNSVIGKGYGLLDKYFPPDKRAVLWAKFNKFMTERPKLGAFLLSQIALSGVPLGIFIIMSVTVALFSIIAALLVALVGSLLFIVFWIGVALIFLLPTLFFTTMVATFLFLWGLGAYYIVKWFNEKEIPGIHTDLVGGLKKKLLEDDGSVSEADKVPALTGVNSAPPKDSPNKRKPEKQQNGSAKEQSRRKSTEDTARSTGSEIGPVGDIKKKADVGNATKTANDVKSNITGAITG